MRHPIASRDSRSAERGRALPIVLALVALAAVGVLFFGEDLGLFGGSDDDGAGSSSLEGDMLGYEDGDGEGAEAGDGGTDLAPLYGDGDRGAIRLRLLWAASGEPVRGQSIDLIDKKGTKLEPVMTDTLGVAEFRKVWPARGYSLMIEGEGFKAVSIRGIVVKRARSTDLQDIYVGENHVHPWSRRRSQRAAAARRQRDGVPGDPQARAERRHVHDGRHGVERAQSA